MLIEENIISKFYHGKPPLDDCCFIPPNTLITTDSMAEGTHFQLNWSTPRDIAIKLIEVNISDIAAGGGIPKFAFLNLGLSKQMKGDSFLKPFIQTFHKELKRYKIQLKGGDTYFSKLGNLSMTLIGTTENPWNRTGGRRNLALYLTGNLGLSNLGLKILSGKSKVSSKKLSNLALQKHRSPRSRLSESKWIQKSLHPQACMDITDGLIQDAKKMANASKIGLQIHLDRIPVFQGLLQYLSWDDVLTSGEELELLFLSDQIFSKTGFTQIGNSTDSINKVEFFLHGKKYFPKSEGFAHFK